MRWQSFLVNILYVAIGVAALLVYIESGPELLGTFVGFWMAIPVVLATAGIFVLSGRRWTQLLWL